MAGFIKDNDTKLLMKFESGNDPWKDTAGNFTFNTFNSYGVVERRYNPFKYNNLKYFGYFGDADYRRGLRDINQSIDYLEYDDSWTIEFFAYHESIPTGSLTTMALSKTDTSSYGTNIYFNLRCDDDGNKKNPCIYLKQDTHAVPRAAWSTSISVTSTAIPVEKRLHHFAIQHSASKGYTAANGNTYWFYMNGKYLGKHSKTSYNNTSNFTRVYIGTSPYCIKDATMVSGSSVASNKNRIFNGYLTNIRISSVARYDEKDYNPDALVDETNYSTQEETLLTFNRDNWLYDERNPYREWKSVGEGFNIVDSTLANGKMCVMDASSYIYTENYCLGGQDFTIDFFRISSGGLKTIDLYHSDYNWIRICLYDSMISIETDFGLQTLAAATTSATPTISKITNAKHVAIVYRHDLNQLRYFYDGYIMGTVTLPRVIDKTNYNIIGIGCNVRDRLNLGLENNNTGTLSLDHFRITQEALWWNAFNVEIPPPEPEIVDVHNDTTRICIDDQYLRDKMRRAYEYK